jgi:hypothetical protein
MSSICSLIEHYGRICQVSKLHSGEMDKRWRKGSKYHESNISQKSRLGFRILPRSSSCFLRKVSQLWPTEIHVGAMPKYYWSFKLHQNLEGLTNQNEIPKNKLTVYFCTQETQNNSYLISRPPLNNPIARSPFSKHRFQIPSKSIRNLPSSKMSPTLMLLLKTHRPQCPPPSSRQNTKFLGKIRKPQFNSWHPLSNRRYPNRRHRNPHIRRWLRMRSLIIYPGTGSRSCCRKPVH